MTTRQTKVMQCLGTFVDSSTCKLDIQGMLAVAWESWNIYGAWEPLKLLEGCRQQPAACQKTNGAIESLRPRGPLMVERAPSNPPSFLCARCPLILATVAKKGAPKTATHCEPQRGTIRPRSDEGSQKWEPERSMELKFSRRSPPIQPPLPTIFPRREPLNLSCTCLGEKRLSSNHTAHASRGIQIQLEIAGDVANG